MVTLSFGQQIVYADERGQQVLLNCSDLFSNKSRISMHRLPGQDFLTIPELLLGLIQQEQHNKTGLEIAFGLIDTLLVRRLIQTSQPVRVLEYGCGNGNLSFHLAKILGLFHEDSVLVCAYDTVDTLCMQWMGRITSVEKLPKISYLAGDYGALHLQRKYFDVVVLNGAAADFLDPQAVIEDALSFITENGLLLCCTNGTPLLESTMKLYFEKREQYNLTPSSSVFAVRAKDRCWSKPAEVDMDTLGAEDVEASQRLRSQAELDRTALSALVRKLQRDTQTAAKLGRIDWKLRLLKEKEMLVELAVSTKWAEAGGN